MRSITPAKDIYVISLPYSSTLLRHPRPRPRGEMYSQKSVLNKLAPASRAALTSASLFPFPCLAGCRPRPASCPASHPASRLPARLRGFTVVLMTT